ncbi:hypothetical protein H6P81_002891 [Aristolochia fimbriata]|uniref:Uncharacterized protein n=1 Tax=Aristolochia fimbriata TaxID=158543 RepID=A0AAV7FBR7_ARIFI|nr:hypothetical protein H6P81_002891 [Aristolochia fimbriata]
MKESNKDNHQSRRWSEGTKLDSKSQIIALWDEMDTIVLSPDLSQIVVGLRNSGKVKDTPPSLQLPLSESSFSFGKNAPMTPTWLV